MIIRDTVCIFLKSSSSAIFNVKTDLQSAGFYRTDGVEHVSSCLVFVVVVVVAVVGNWTLDLMTPWDDLTLNFDLTKVRLCLVYP